VVVTFFSGDRELCRRVADEVRALVPDRRHFVATEANWPSCAASCGTTASGLPGDAGAPTQRSAPRGVPAGPAQDSGLQLASGAAPPAAYASVLSVLARRAARPHLSAPWWWPWPKRERTVTPTGDRVLEGRPCSPERRRIAVLSPYFPYPLAHGGAVRIFNLLREAAREFDIELFAFTDDDAEPPAAPVLEFCARVVLVTKPRYREPRWSTLLPPEVHEFHSPAMHRAIARERAAFGFEALQVEYTQLAGYLGDALVEHDVTFDLFAQVARRERTVAAWWIGFAGAASKPAPSAPRAAWSQCRPRTPKCSARRPRL